MKMKSSFKKLPGSKIELEVSLDKKEFLPYYEAVKEKALASVHLKGFRPGTAPKEIAEQALDKEEIFNEAVENAVRWSLEEVSKGEEWTLIDSPKIEIKETKDLGLAYKATMVIFPEVKLGNYKKIAHNVLKDKKEITVDPKEIEQTLEWIRNSRKEGDKIPELNDDFAKSLGKFTNVQELKDSVVSGLKMEKEYKEQDRLRIKIMEEIVQASKIDTPEVMVEKTYENMKKEMGHLPEKDLRERARRNVDTNLIIYKIAQAERLEPKPEEIAEDKNYNYNYDVAQRQRILAFLESQ